MKFCVISDLHYYDRSLGIIGEAFESMCQRESKVLQYSEEIFDKIIADVLETDITHVFFTGDFTANGETINHDKFAEKLEIFTSNGVEVFIIPGNHDLGKQYAFKYLGGEKTVEVQTIDKDNYLDRYRKYGYKQALSIDKNSLSYLCEFDDFYALFVDSASASKIDFPDKVVISGKILSETQDWMRQSINQYCIKDKPIVSLMHHGLLEHFPHQKELYSDFLVDDSDNLAETFVDFGIRLVLTGHHHANSIAREKINGVRITDVQCGSPLTSPLAYKVFEIHASQAKMETRYVSDIKGVANAELHNKAASILQRNIDYEIDKSMSSKGLDVLGDARFREFVVSAMNMYYSGKRLSNQEMNAVIKSFDTSSVSQELIYSLKLFSEQFSHSNNGLSLDISIK